MGTFIHTPDNDIKIDDSVYPYDWWITQETEYALPDGMTSQIYVQGSHHTLYDDNSQYAGEYPWTDGNTYISNKSTYDSAYETYLEPTLEQAKIYKIGGLKTKMAEVRAGKVVFNTQTYYSNDENYKRLFTEKDLFVYEEAVPGGYYVTDDEGDENSLTLANLQDLVALMQNLYYDCWLNYDDHYAAIMALTTVAQVEAYDYTTGWPTVPYTGT